MSPSVKDKLVGSWNLVSCEYRRTDGSVILPFGRNPVGRIMYDAQGHMSAQIMGADRPLFASGDLLKGTPEEIKAAFEGMIAYFGPYEVSEGEGFLTHHVEGCSFPNWIGSDQKRFFEFSGNRLTISHPPVLVGGPALAGVLIWERVA